MKNTMKKIITIAVFLAVFFTTAFAVNAAVIFNRNVVLKQNVVFNSLISWYVNQKYQTIDDWENGAGTSGEYTGEEATWSAVSGSPFAGYADINYFGATDLYSGEVKKDDRTGLWWSDIMAVGGTASTTSNEFSAATDGVRPTDGNAVGFCDALNTASFGGYTDWYLPTQKQLQQAYIDGSANNLSRPYYYFWSSTEVSVNTANAWRVTLHYGNTDTNTKTSKNNVRCVR